MNYKQLEFSLIFSLTHYKPYFFEIIFIEGFAIKNYAPTFASPYRKDGKKNKFWSGSSVG
ncbi:hypothetical protein GCM10027429_20190 [Marivirga atlantica]